MKKLDIMILTCICVEEGRVGEEEEEEEEEEKEEVEEEREGEEKKRIA